MLIRQVIARSAPVCVRRNVTLWTDTDKRDQASVARRLSWWDAMTTTDTPRKRGRPRGSTKTASQPTPDTTISLPPGKAGLTPDEVANALGISRAQVYVMLDAGDFVSFHIGRKRRVLASSVQEYVERRIAAEGRRPA